MRKIYTLIAAIVVLTLANQIYAQNATKSFRGAVGEHKVQMTLTRAGNKLTGTYQYSKVGKDLHLAGTIDAQGNFQLNESETPAGAKTGEFKGAWKSENGETVSLAGDWVNAKTKEVFGFIAEEQMIFLTGGARLVAKTYRDVNKPKEIEIDTEYPELVGFKDAGIAAKFNQMVKALVLKEAAEFKKLMSELTEEDIEMARDRGITNFLEMSYSVDFANDKVISIGWGGSTYTGGAHPNHFSQTVNFDLRTGKKIELADLFKSNSNYLKIVSDFCIRDLKRQIQEMTDDEWLENGAGLKEENFKSWNIRKNGISINFDPYQVAAYAAGAFEVTIPFSELKGVLRENTVVSGM